MKLIDADAKEPYMLDGKYAVNISKRGEWIYQFRDSENEEYRCSKCGFPQGDKPNFCPNCGADMRGKGDEHSDFR